MLNFRVNGQCQLGISKTCARIVDITSTGHAAHLTNVPLPMVQAIVPTLLALLALRRH